MGEPKKIQSDFAILDVKHGRKKLFDHLGHDLSEEEVPVTITGKIRYAFGNDDGVSQEFTVDVESVVIND